MNRLKELRKSKNLTQVELANFIGISQNNYSYWENGKVKIDNQSLKKLSTFYDVSIDYILGNENNNIISRDEIETLDLYKKLTDIEKNKTKGYMQGLLDNRVNQPYNSYNNNSFNNSIINSKNNNINF